MGRVLKLAPMKLSRIERLILLNQYHILEALYPEQKEYFERAQEAIGEGYELEYESLAQHVYDDKDTLNEEQCREVTKILSMFDALRVSYNAQEDKTGIEEESITFRGFDGNDRVESAYLGYVRYLTSGGKFKELSKGGDFNSHMGMLSNYRDMLEKYQNIETERRFKMTREDIIQITSARYPNKK